MTRPLTCGNAQLKMFNTIVGNNSAFNVEVDRLAKERIREKREKTAAERHKEDKSAFNSFFPSWKYHKYESDDREHIQEWFASEEEKYKTSPFRFRNYMISNETGWTLRFGPERSCDDGGNDTEDAAGTLGFALQSLVSDYDDEGKPIHVFVEHKLNRTISFPKDTKTHLYTLEIDVMSYQIYIDMVPVASGSLGEDFEPPLFFEEGDHEEFIDDPSSRKPAWWIDDAHGEWKPRKIANPVKNKWVPLTDNQGYLKYVPFIGSSAIGMGFEMYTKDAGFFVDNILVNNGKVANVFEYAKKSWRVKYEAQCERDGDCPPMWWKETPLIADIIFATTNTVHAMYIAKMYNLHGFIVMMLGLEGRIWGVADAMEKLDDLWTKWTLSYLHATLAMEGRETEATAYWIATMLLLLAANVAVFAVLKNIIGRVCELYHRLENALPRFPGSRDAKSSSKGKGQKDDSTISKSSAVDSGDNAGTGSQPRRRLRSRRDTSD